MMGVLILSNRRADNLKTMSMLERNGYMGEVRIVVDDEDPTIDEYVKRYGDKVVTFCKSEFVSRTQTITPSSDTPMGCVVYARNAAPEIAKSLGWDYFIELDDDYDRFEYRWVEGGKLKTRPIKDVTGLFNAMRRFVEKSGADVLALAQGGDFIGGAESTGAKQRFLRKVMNVYCFPADTDIRFTGYLNEDLTTSVLEGSKGKVMLTCTSAEVHQTQTQKSAGGLSEEYKRHGTYAKSMCSVVVSPSCVSLNTMGNKNMRIHHKVRWNNAVPKIVRG